jgi:hypothetical protein
MKNQILPVLIIGYARKSTLIGLIEVATSSNISAIYISIDGPKNDSVKRIQDEILETLALYQKKISIPIRILRRNENLGAGAAVVAAIDWFFSLEEEGVVLEDDLVVDKTLFRYVSEVLPKVRSNSRILSISGTRLLPSTELQPSLSSYPLAWGWATTRDKWMVMRSLIFKRSSPLRDHNSVKEWIFWRTGKRRALNSYIDAWDIPLAEGMISSNYFTLVPPINLVSNVGFDSSATHTISPEWPLNLPRLQNYPAPTILNLEKSVLFANDQFMRSEVYAISHRHLISGVLALILDPLRFMKQHKNVSLLKKSSIKESNNDS